MTMPLRGREIVLAEIAGTSVPTAIMQYLILLSGMLALSFMPDKAPSVAIRLGVLIGAPALRVAARPISRNSGKEYSMRSASSVSASTP